jgi:hypothetical protein
MHRLVITDTSIHQDYGAMNHGQFHSRWLLNIFGVKNKTQDDINHLIGPIKSMYTLTKDWTGNLYCGITLNWDYKNRTVDILMLG